MSEEQNPYSEQTIRLVLCIALESESDAVQKLIERNKPLVIASQ